jgi:hypothetical protein
MIMKYMVDRYRFGKKEKKNLKKQKIKLTEQLLYSLKWNRNDR